METSSTHPKTSRIIGIESNDSRNRRTYTFSDTTNTVTDEEPPRDWGKRPKPQSIFFYTKNNSMVAAQAGSKAILPCVVRNYCDGTISWVRRSDYNLLTVGPNTYAGDERFHILHTFNSDDWSLQIRFVELRDTGAYECQVTSHPPFSILVHLQVVEAHTNIHGPAERFVKLGSSFELVCTVRDSPVLLEFMFWYQNERMVNYDMGDDIIINLDLNSRRSSLVIKKATREHTGNYTCIASNAYPSSTIVHVLNDENPAAMQTGAASIVYTGNIFFSASVLLIYLLSSCD